MDEHFPPIIRQWLDNQRNANNESIDTTTKDAANIVGASQAASATAKGTEPVNRKERRIYNAVVRPLKENALQLWAHNKDLWISEDDFAKQYEMRQIGAGAEQKVYLHENGREVIKVNTGTYHGNWPEFFNRLLCQAILFPTTKYSMVGFTSVEQTFAVIIQ
jgi:hypothetical protein